MLLLRDGLVRLYAATVKLRVLRQDKTVLLLVAVILILALVGISTLWPDAFGIAIAIAGTFGALMVIYEIRLTKRIAQAEFIRDLQSGFALDDNIRALWHKLLLGKQVTPADRPLVSSYLTFFETLYLLLARGALELRLIDDLFRNRFFTAVGNQAILDTALAKEAGAFANVHDLVEEWFQYLVNKRLPIHPGYYDYVRGMAHAKGYTISRLGAEDLKDVLSLQGEVLKALDDATWVRANSDEMLRESLEAHITLGVHHKRELVAVGILYDGKGSPESIRKHFTQDPDALASSINLKLVMNHPDHRGRGLGRCLVDLLEQQATQLGKDEILCTIHPKNKRSRALFARVGYKRYRSVHTAYGRRRVYVRSLSQRKKHWAR